MKLSTVIVIVIALLALVVISMWKAGFLDDIYKSVRRKIIDLLLSLISAEIEKLKRMAKELGEKTGYQKGLEDGKGVWEVTDSRSIPNERELDCSVFGPKLFPVTEQLREQMRQEVAAAVASGLISPPTDQQWEMILSDHPSTCVLAGAGSGKSTTLVLRVVFMLAHLGVKIDEMTVVSFTRDSCGDLRDKLVDVAPHWNLPIDVAAAKNLVRTFHSALHRMGRGSLPGIAWFENIGRANETTEDSEDPLSSSINVDQFELLKEAYVDLYEKDSVFKEAILKMLDIQTARDLYQLEKPESFEKKTRIIKIAGARDLEMVGKVNYRWRTNGLWPINGVDPTPYKAFEIHGVWFYANGKVENSGLPIFLGAGSQKDNLFLETEKIGLGDNESPLIRAIHLKRQIVNSCFGKASAYLNTRNMRDSLETRIRYLDQKQSDVEAPMISVCLGGEKGPAKLFEAFVSQASFIESMGLEVTKFVSTMMPFRQKDIDHYFCLALGRFWPHFERLLQSRRMMTFNRGFMTLSEVPPGYGAKTEFVRTCAPLTHLLIDEFQDISSQIVDWIRNAQRLLAAKNRNPSIMAIGDDWQSIYGWRGSSPEFFIKFDRYFKVHPALNGKGRVCPMGQNFRSIPEVVEHGNRVLYPVKMKTPKQVFSKVPKDPGDHGVKLIPQGGMDEKKYMKEIVNAIHSQYNELSAKAGGDKKKVLVIGRTNTTIKDIEKLIGTKKGMIYRTIHRSKGLQAEAAVICDDCTTEGPHPIRDRVYALMTGFECKSYEDAQRDEALRLAYVAVTRGIRRVYWFARKADGAAKTLLN